VADYLTTGHGRDKAAVIAAFVSPSEKDWRFSFIKLDYRLDTTESGIVATRPELTPARRYSYLVGEGENCHTAQKQFLELLETDFADPSILTLEAAFSVEKVTQEFFGQYRRLFEKCTDALKAFLKSQPQVASDFSSRGITPEDFAKKLLGQIVFLYFLQKKGWFGVERGKPWGSGQKDFVRYLFNYRAKYAHTSISYLQPNFFNDILEPLFYEALAAPRLDDDHYYSRFDCRIPFLNGGLFEPLYGYSWVETDILLPDSLFSNDELTGDGDVGTGILDVFGRYNFTVNEAEPLEKEVAVDPEMLGKIFENLLPENVRRSGGTYYTPRVIVHYMCRRSLQHYLEAQTPDIPDEEIDSFLHFAERFADFEAKQTQAHMDKRLPESIGQNADRLDELLASITVCDPAVGSGAFPVGMMQEIVRARMALTTAIRKVKTTIRLGKEDPRSAYALKRHAIQHSLYGVDEDPGAVEIAKLRLWLSMVVDEGELADIQPLPNLDYKIMQGNSLLDEFDGVRLLDERLLEQEDEAAPAPRIALNRERQKRLEAEMLRLQSSGQMTRKLAVEIKEAGARLARELSILENPAQKTNAEQPYLNLGSLSGLKRIRQLHAEIFDESSRTKKAKLRTELENTEWEFMRATLHEQGREEALVKLEKAAATHRKPFFLWRLHFAEVFQDSGGFDVVIANPPYIRMELIKDQKAALKRRFPQLFAGRADLYVYFYGLGLSILRARGCLAFISSNTYLNVNFGEHLRKYLLETTTVTTLVDFAETKVFDAVVEPAIIVVRKPKTADALVSCTKWREDQSLEELPEIASKGAARVPQTSFSSEPWRLVGGVESRLLASLNRGTPLQKIATDGILYGVKTGLNKAFILTAEQSRKLCQDPHAKEIIKPFIRGKDIGRWTVRPTEAWLIYTYHGVDIKKYPLIEEHLRQYKAELERRATRQAWYELQQPQYRYSLLFAKPKIVYQDISRTFAFAYDKKGSYCGDTTFVLPTPSLAVIGILQSSAVKWWVHTDQGVPFGGFLRLKAQYMQRCPIPAMTGLQESILSRLVEYILWLYEDGTESLPLEEGRALVAGYFERWLNALAYELFLPESLHAVDLRFFDLAKNAKLRPISEMKGKEMSELKGIFEALYQPDTALRQGLFALDSLDEVRIMEGKG